MCEGERAAAAAAAVCALRSDSPISDLLLSLHQHINKHAPLPPPASDDPINAGLHSRIHNSRSINAAFFQEPPDQLAHTAAAESSAAGERGKSGSLKYYF